MKYQALKHNKTTRPRLIGLYDTLADAVTAIKTQGGEFLGISYVGGFPMFKNNGNGKLYSVQGLAMPIGIVCSLPEKEPEIVAVCGKVA